MAILSKLFVFFMIAVPLATTAQAQEPVTPDEVYISDVLFVGLRDGQSEDSPTIRLLKSDTPLQVLEEDDELVKVKTREGEEGWIKKRYTTTNVPKPVVIERLTEELERRKTAEADLRAENQRLRSSLQNEGKIATDVRPGCEQDLKESREEVSRVKTELARLEEENREVARLKEENKRLIDRSEENTTAEQRLASLDAENRKLQTELKRVTQELTSLGSRSGDGDPYWMVWMLLAGAGIWLIGLILGKMSRKKEYY